MQWTPDSGILQGIKEFCHLGFVQTGLTIFIATIINITVTAATTTAIATPKDDLC